jgi:hypothetical protein
VVHPPLPVGLLVANADLHFMDGRHRHFLEGPRV